MTDAAAPYITRINHVKEVNLFGAADLPLWQALLKPRGLTPYDDKGQALLLLAATDLRWLGIRFQEFTVSVLVSRQEEGRGQNASYSSRGNGICAPTPRTRAHRPSSSKINRPAQWMLLAGL